MTSNKQKVLLSDGDRKRRWLIRMWLRDSQCFYCHEETVLMMRRKRQIKLRQDAATIEHLRSRLHPNRQEPAHGDVRWVLACHKCNHQRGREDEAALSIDELHKRSGHASHYSLLTIEDRDHCIKLVNANQQFNPYEIED